MHLEEELETFEKQPVNIATSERSLNRPRADDADTEYCNMISRFF
jgi:hypothetical protein